LTTATERMFGTSASERIKSTLWKNFIQNFERIKNQKPIATYPDRWYQLHGIPTPRQYIAWNKAIKKIGVDRFFKELPLELVYLEDDEVLIADRFSKLFNHDDELEITIACGYFWKGHNKCREKMMDFLNKENYKKSLKKWHMTIYTQDASLKEYFRVKCKIKHNIYIVPFRIDLHYTIVKNKTNSKNSHVFIELPHSELFYFRLNTHFSLDEVNNFECGNKEEFLDFLDSQRKRRLLTKSIPSKLNFAFNLR